jgi:hypothetical protein
VYACQPITSDTRKPNGADFSCDLANSICQRLWDSPVGVGSELFLHCRQARACGTLRRMKRIPLWFNLGAAVISALFIWSAWPSQEGNLLAVGTFAVLTLTRIVYGMRTTRIPLPALPWSVGNAKAFSAPRMRCSS